MYQHNNNAVFTPKNDRCVEPYAPFHNAQMLIYNAVSGGEQGTAEEWALKLSTFPGVFGPHYVTDGERLKRVTGSSISLASWDA